MTIPAIIAMPENEGSGHNILIVDDDDNFTEGLDLLLTTEGYTVQCANNIAAATDALNRFDADLILVDLHLGRESGIDLIDQLNALRPLISCVLMTAYVEIEAVVSTLRHGAQDFLTKPIQKDLLLKVLDRCFERRELKKEKAAVEERLLKSEARLKDAQRIAKIGYSIWDEKEDREVYSSGEAERIFGVPHGQLAKDFDEHLAFVHPDDRENVKAVNEQSLRDHTGYDVEYKIVRPDGEMRHVREIAELEFDEAAEHVRTISTIQDITEQKSAEEALREAHDKLEQRVEERTSELQESEKLFKHAARTARLGHWHFDEVKNEYLSISDEYARIFGYTVEDFLNLYRTLEQDMDLVLPADREKVLEGYEMSEGMEFDYRIVRKDGNIRYVREYSRHILDESGNLVEAVGTLQDVTELKQAQHEAERANFAKSEFLSRMSHELRTPLNAILGFSQMLAIDATLNEKHKKYVGYVLSAGNHLLELINEVLDLEKIGSGRLQLIMEAVDPGEVLKECAHLIQSLAEKHHVTMENHVTPNSVPRVWADKMRLKQVLLNLVSNAIKYNREGGRVTVSCEETGEGLLRISVSDTGLGIPVEHMGELFEPFSRLGAEQSGIEGTGIGLTITKRLVKLMGGELGVDTTQDEGCTFWVDLRLDPPVSE